MFRDINVDDKATEENKEITKYSAKSSLRRERKKNKNNRIMHIGLTWLLCRGLFFFYCSSNSILSFHLLFCIYAKFHTFFFNGLRAITYVNLLGSTRHGESIWWELIPHFVLWPSIQVPHFSSHLQLFSSTAPIKESWLSSCPYCFPL